MIKRPGQIGPSFSDRASVTEVVLPSLGQPYINDKGSIIPGGSVLISAMTVAEEKLMAQKNADPSRKLCVLLDRVCDLRGLKADQLLVADQFFLLIKVRSLSYGNTYTFPFRCDDCGNQWKPTLNLEKDLNLTMVDEEWREPLEVSLPVSGKTVQYRMLRAADEIELNTKKIRKDQPNEDPTFVAILARCLLSVDGEALSSPRIAEGWLEKQAVRDRAAITDSIKANTPGYSGDVAIECPSCGFVHEAAVPMTSDFFRPDVSS